MDLVLFFIPDEMLPLLIMGIGFALIFRIVSVGWAFGFIASLVILHLLSPFIESLIGGLIDSMDPWLLTLLMILLTFYLLRLLLSLILGREGASSFLGRVAYDIFLLPFRAVAGLFRLFLWRGGRRVR